MSRPAGRRAAVLHLAVLGLLHESPMHGYELRKRLNAALGVFRALSYGTLYPCLRDLVGQGLITETVPLARRARGAGLAAAAVAAAVTPGGASTRRARIVYQLTADGKEHLEALLSEAGPGAWDDDTFDVRFALFARTEAAVRLRILEGRRARVEERLHALRALDKNPAHADAYAAELRRHGQESVEHEVRWLSGLIEAERKRLPAGREERR